MSRDCLSGDARARELLCEAIAGGDNTGVRALIALDRDKAWPFLRTQLDSHRLKNDDLVRVSIVAEAIEAQQADASTLSVLDELLRSRLSFVRTKAVAIASEWPSSTERVSLLKGISRAMSKRIARRAGWPPAR